jgi:hypothetical protein
MSFNDGFVYVSKSCRFVLGWGWISIELNITDWFNLKWKCALFRRRILYGTKGFFNKIISLFFFRIKHFPFIVVTSPDNLTFPVCDLTLIILFFDPFSKI